MQPFAGFTLIIGSILFLIAAFMPISLKVFPEPDEQKRLDVIQNDRTGWNISCVLFGAGSVIAVIGLGLFALHIQTVSDNNLLKLIDYLAAIVAGIGALMWVIIVYNRIILPAESFTGNPNIKDWMFPVYTIFTQLAMIAIGVVLLQTGYPAWLGFGVMIVAALFLIGYLILKDMPPFTHYLIMLVIGIMLTR
jgi:hypothetical protein